MNGLAVCAGIGGLELGVGLAVPEYRTVCYVERDAFCAALLVARMEEAALDPAPIWDDLFTFDCRPWRGTVDLLTAGFPCQPFSVAGKRHGSEDDRWLWPDIARIIGDCLPAVVFLENVPGLVRHGLRHVWGDLRRMGFRVRAGFFSAAEVGAPHRRQRLFILADRIGGAVWDEPGKGNGARGSGTPEPAIAGEAVVYAAGARLEGRPDPTPTWPPQRESKRASWPRGLEPGIRRVADGPSDWVDRVRSLGNGVVPLVAANAFRTLADQ